MKWKLLKNGQYIKDFFGTFDEVMAFCFNHPGADWSVA